LAEMQAWDDMLVSLANATISLMQREEEEKDKSGVDFERQRKLFTKERRRLQERLQRAISDREKTLHERQQVMISLTHTDSYNSSIMHIKEQRKREREIKKQKAKADKELKKKRREREREKDEEREREVKEINRDRRTPPPLPRLSLTP